MHYLISKADNTLQGTILLPSSKSISNRVLIINSLSYSPYTIDNLSDSDDTKVLDEVLNTNSTAFNIGHAGTAMRFLTAFLSKIAGEWTLTGSERMQQRPIGILVDALRQLGASIEYINHEGYPPLLIRGSALKGAVIELDGSISSQYISALLMIAPTVKGGMILRLLNNMTSKPYILLTLELMKEFGVDHTWSGNEIRIEQQDYTPVQFSVEADWSGASYWYAMAALSEQPDLLLKGLRIKSLQGDSIQAEWFQNFFGVQSKQEGNDVRLTKLPMKTPKKIVIDFIENPDIAQTFAVLAVCKKIPFHFKGLLTLKIKETNRILALQQELAKFGAMLTEPIEGELAWDGVLESSKVAQIPVVETYHDHRMALAFAPAALTYPQVGIADPMVITKSYPNYWNDLKMLGFKVDQK
ncbi:MAG: 3-phosphoshikimate 1-carboxyvinyltransferase [Bacteroidia bacterium]|nr:3-phosphoshikimate 1-carboxyvinyltransferase [Bacteroidia bacterium]